jgi:aspartyl/asparaginyl beta-hydroxylase (cupin superfamily)
MNYDEMSPEERREERRLRRQARDAATAARRPGESAIAHFLRVRIRAAVLRVGRNIRPAVNGYLGRHSLLGDSPWFEREQFAWAPALEARWELVRKEAEQVLAERDRLPPLHEISPDHARIDYADDRWKVFFLKGYGIWLEDHCQKCPQTYEAVRDIPGLESAFFSILEAGKRIPRHRGPSRTIFTAHLGLMVPQDSERCWIRVNRIQRGWEPGRLIFFDDTYKHEVANDTAEDRVVLLLHIRRPVRFPASLVRDALFNAIRWSPFVRDGLRNQRRWKERLARDEGQRGRA